MDSGGKPGGQRDAIRRKRSLRPTDAREEKEMHPETHHQRLEKRAAPHQAIPTIVENVENLEFIRTTLWKNAETHVFQAFKTAHGQASDQVIKHLHSFQHAPEQAFYRSL